MPLALITWITRDDDARPEHPIYYPPPSGGGGQPTYPVQLPVFPWTPTHPIAPPPSSGQPGVPTHPIYNPPGIWGGPPNYVDIGGPMPQPPPPRPPGLPGQLPTQDPSGTGWVYAFVPGYGWMWCQVPPPPASGAPPVVDNTLPSAPPVVDNTLPTPPAATTPPPDGNTGPAHPIQPTVPQPRR